MDQQYLAPRTFVIAAIALLLGCAGVAWGQTTAFSYQGKLTEAGNPASGAYDLQFKLFDTAAIGTGTQQGATQVVNPATASAGVFTVTLDFGANVFNGANRYLEVGVRPSGSGNPYTILDPRQQITSSPYALQTLNAQQLGGLPANRYVASSANGNVGIGTANPTHAKLDVDGGAGNGIYASSSAQTAVTGDSGTNTGVYGNSNSGTAVYGTSNSYVGVWGKSTSHDGVRGETASGAYAINGYHSGGGIGTFGNTTGSGTGVKGNSPAGNGVVGTSVSGTGVYGESSAAPSLTLAGVYGKGLGAGTTGVLGASGSGTGVGVFGVSNSSTGFGVYAKNTAGGRPLYVEGHANQNGDAGGFVKAMVQVSSGSQILRCFNSTLTGVASTTVPCGFSLDRGCLNSTCTTTIDFGFSVATRFWSLAIDRGSGGNTGTNVRSFTANTLTVSMWTANERFFTDTSGEFSLIVF